MKALSIKQPWAWLICAGYKDIENRTWRIGRNPRHGPYSSRDVDNFTITLPERVYVHAGKQSDLNVDTAVSIQRIMLAQDRDFGDAFFWEKVLAFGVIIGEATITACVTESASPWFTGPYGFVLVEPRLYAKPIPCRGQLGFFEPQIDFTLAKPEGK